MAADNSTVASQHELPELPNGAVMLARAGATALRRPKGEPSLPRNSVTVRGLAVEPDKLRAYCQVCGSTPGDSLPLTYPHVRAEALQLWLMAQPDFPLPMLGLVHLANHFEQSAPIAVERKLDYTVRLDSTERTDRGLEFGVVTTAADGSNELWQGVSTYLFRMRRSGPKPEKKTPPPLPALDLQQTLPVPEDTGRRYAAVSGDYNPIHLHALSAKLFGFPRAIAHGMWSAARCLAMLETAHSLSSSSMQLRFRQPLLLPATTELRSRTEGGKVEFLLVGKQDRLHMDGTLD